MPPVSTLRAGVAALLLLAPLPALVAAEGLLRDTGPAVLAVAPEKSQPLGQRPARPPQFDWARRADGGGVATTGALQPKGAAPPAVPAALAPIVSGDGAIADFFATALAFDGTRLYVGTPQDAVPSDLLGGLDAGSVRLYTRSGATWQRAGLIAPVGGGVAESYGRALAQAGTLLAVGAPFATIDNQPDRGAIYLYRLGAGAPQLLVRLVSPEPQSGERFGAALATDGQRVLVGAPRRGLAAGAEQGRAWLYEEVAGTWTAVTDFVAPDAEAGDRFGSGVALDGDLAVIGAPAEEAPGSPSDRGAAYAFVRAAGGAWSAGQKLSPSAVGASAGFGTTLLLGPTRLVVGASNDTVDGGNRGAAYVFSRSGSSFTESQRLVASDGVAGDAYGAALAWQGNELLVGAPARARAEGAGYLYADEGAGYAERAILDPNDGGFSDVAGSSLVLLPDQALLGAPLDDVGPNRAQGSVQVFARSGAAWTEVDSIDTGDGAENERFGLAVAAGSGLVAVGSFLDEVEFNKDDMGTVTMFRRGAAGFEPDARLSAPDGDRDDYLGFSVAMLGSRLVAAAPRAVIDGFFDQGALYEFERAPDGWRFVTKLVTADGLFGDTFGFSLAADGTRLLVGTPGYDAFDFDSGAAYLFERDASGRYRLTGFLTPPPGSTDYAAGITVALAGDIALVGAPQATVGTRQAQGLVLVYARSDAGWTLRQTLSAADGSAGDLFGSAIAVREGRIAVGALGDDTGNVLDHGAVYVYEPGQFGNYGAPQKLVPEALAPRLGLGSALLWQGEELLAGATGAPGADGDAQQGQAWRYQPGSAGYVPAGVLEAPQGAAREFFGRSFATDRDLLVVGAPEKARDNPREGAAYVFTAGEPGLADGFE